MKREEKLKIAIDFIADYLSPALPVEKVTEKVTEDIEDTDENVLVETESEDHLTRAYTLMKKLEAMDRENAEVNKQVKKVVNPIKEELKKKKAEYENKLLEVEKLIEHKEEGSQVGVTLDEKTGNMIRVVVEPLPSSNPIPPSETGKISPEVMEKMINTPITMDRAVIPPTNTETVNLTDTEIEVQVPLTHNED